MEPRRSATASAPITHFAFEDLGASGSAGFTGFEAAMALPGAAEDGAPFEVRSGIALGASMGAGAVVAPLFGTIVDCGAMAGICAADTIEGT